MNDVVIRPYKDGGEMAFVVETAKHRLLADEPVDKGGSDSGFAPFDFLAASLGTCTAMTLRYYAKHKGYELGSFEVTVTPERRDDGMYFKRNLQFHLPHDAERLQKFHEIANKCPVHKVLQGNIIIETVVSTSS